MLYLLTFTEVMKNDKSCVVFPPGIHITLRRIEITNALKTTGCFIIIFTNVFDRGMHVVIWGMIYDLASSLDSSNLWFYFRRDSGLSRVLGSMTKLFSKNIARSTDLLFLKSLVGSNACIRHESAILVSNYQAISCSIWLIYNVLFVTHYQSITTFKNFTLP